MDEKEVKKILLEHEKWLRGESEKPDLRSIDLRYANLCSTDLSSADLRSTDLRYANLCSTDLSSADLRSTDLSYADLSYANLSSADLRYANLSSADLSSANLCSADLRSANLSCSKGLLSSSEWITKNFKKDKLGIIVYKAIGNTNFEIPEKWVIKNGLYISEVVNPLPTINCACGVNFGTLEWCKKNYPNSVIWKCRIRWIDVVSVVVPYNTDGKARCEKLELIEVVKASK